MGNATSLRGLGKFTVLARHDACCLLAVAIRYFHIGTALVFAPSRSGTCKRGGTIAFWSSFLNLVDSQEDSHPKDSHLVWSWITTLGHVDYSMTRSNPYTLPPPSFCMDQSCQQPPTATFRDQICAAVLSVEILSHLCRRKTPHKVLAVSPRQNRLFQQSYIHAIIPSLPWVPHLYPPAPILDV